MRKTLLLAALSLMLGATTYAQKLQNGAVTFPVANEGTTGTTLNGTAIVNPSNLAINASTSNTTVPVYICLLNCGTSGNAGLAMNGLAPCTMDGTNASAAGNFYIIQSTSANKQCHAQAAAPAAGTWVIGYLAASSTTINTTAMVWVDGYVFGGSGGGGGTANPLCTDFPVAGAWAPTTLVSGHVYCPTSNSTYTVGATPISFAADSYIVCPNQSTIIQGTSAGTDMFDAGNSVHRWGQFNCTWNDGGVVGGYLLHANGSTGNDDVILQNILIQAPTRTNSRNGLVRLEGGKNHTIRKLRFTGPLLEIGLYERTDQAIVENPVIEQILCDNADSNDACVVEFAPASNFFIGGSTRDITCNMLAGNNRCFQGAVQYHTHYISNIGCYMTSPLGDSCAQIFGMYSGGMNHLWLYVNVGAGGKVDSGTIAWKLGDMYGATINDIKCDGQGAVKACVQFIDGDGYVVDGVMALGMNVSNGTNGVQVNIGSNTVNNTHALFKNINVQWAAGTPAGTLRSVVLDCTGAGAGHNCDDHIFDGVSVSGGQSGIDAFTIIAPPASVTTSHTQIRNWIFDGAFSHGFTIGTGVIGTTIEHGKAPAITAGNLLNDSGTNTQMVGHTTKLTSGTLSTGTVTITLVNDDAFSSGSTYLCNGSDQTTPANAVSFTYTSGTAFTITGTGSDVIRYQCRGY
jgi:hypothetical protein